MAANLWSLVFLLFLYHGRISATSTTPTPGNTPSPKNCTLEVHPDIPIEIKSLLTGGAKLIRYTLNIPDLVETTDVGNELSVMYQPLRWVRSTGRQGIGLLFLSPNFVQLSLTTLNVDVETLTVDVTETPDHCLNKLEDKEREKLIRNLVMNDFQNTSAVQVSELKPEDCVCNQHIVDRGGTAGLEYMCCQRNEYGQVHCKYLEHDIWLTILFSSIALIEALVILFSPLLVPETYYRVKHVAAPYLFRCSSGKKIVLNTTVTNKPEVFLDTGIMVKMSKLKCMENFKRYILSINMEEQRQIALDRIELKVKHDRILTEDYAPVRILQALYDCFFKCNLRRSPAVRDCCDADFMSKSPCGKTCSWYRVLRGFMTIVLLLLLTVPWLLRVGAYYKWEHVEMEHRKDVASSRNLSFSYPGSFTLYLTPIHAFFLCVYCFLIVEAVMFGILATKVQEKVKMVIRQCFRDMREISKMEVFAWVVRVLIKPCRAYGGCGILIGFFYWIFAFPALVIVVAFYAFPTLNITLRLLCYFIIHLLPRRLFGRTGVCSCLYRILGGLNSELEINRIAKQNILDKKLLDSFSNRFQQLLVIVLSLISMYFIIFLIVELLSFIVEIIAYTMMGIILNSDTILTYFSILILVGLYGNDCYGNVTNKFMCFNKKMHDVVLGTCKEQVEKEAYTNNTNKAFMVSTPHSSQVKAPVELVKSKEGCLQWNVKRLCLFFSKNDEPLIPTEFYFQTCRMPYYAAPGELLLSYLYATVEFGTILLFLLFVLIVVMAFGDTYELSVTNQLLATVFGGLIPFMFRKVFKTTSFANIDEGNINFQTSFNDVLEGYEESWPVYDIDVKEYIELDGAATSEKVASVDQDQVVVDMKPSNTQKQDDPQADTEPCYTVDLVIDASEMDPADFDGMNKKSMSGDSGEKETEFQMTMTDTKSNDDV